jgi:hypothetical protein
VVTRASGTKSHFITVAWLYGPLTSGDPASPRPRQFGRMSENGCADGCQRGACFQWDRRALPSSRKVSPLGHDPIRVPLRLVTTFRTYPEPTPSWPRAQSALPRRQLTGLRFPVTRRYRHSTPWSSPNDVWSRPSLTPFPNSIIPRDGHCHNHGRCRPVTPSILRQHRASPTLVARASVVQR